MKLDTARSLSDLLLRHLAEQNEILAAVQVNEPPDQFLRVRAIIGQTMGAICADALNPIYNEYPALKPFDLK